MSIRRLDGTPPDILDGSSPTDSDASGVSEREAGVPRPMSQASALRSGLVYTVASAAPRAVGFALLPVFTRVLSPSAYGELSVALSVTAVASILFALGFDVAVFRNVIRLEDDPRARDRFVRSTWTFLLVAPWVMAIACGAVAAPIFGATNVLNSDQLVLALIAAAIAVGATTVPMVLLRSEDRFRDYMLMTGTNMIVSTGLSLLFVVWYRGGVTGYLLRSSSGISPRSFSPSVSCLTQYRDRSIG